MIPVTPRISLDERELSFSFIRASGPGGQNVNKVSSAVQLRFDVRNSASLPESVKARLEVLAGRRLTQDGVLVLLAQQHRSQERNREDAIARLVDLVRQAGYTARFQIGQVTVSGTDFANWTGVSDIQAACRLLSSGGIPAAFNGASASPADLSLIHI